MAQVPPGQQVPRRIHRSHLPIIVATYVLATIVPKRLGIELSLHAMLQILSITPFEKVPSLQLLTDSDTLSILNLDRNQMKLL